MIHFLELCLLLAFMLMIGGFLLNIGMMVIVWIGILIAWPFIAIKKYIDGE